MKPRIVRRTSLWAFCVLAWCAILTGIVLVWTVAAPSDSTGDSLMATSVVLGIGWVMTRLGRSRIEVHESGLALVDWWRREWIPWGAYRSVEKEDGLVIHTRGMEQHILMSFGSSMIEMALDQRGKGLLTRTVEAIRAGRLKASPESLKDRDIKVQRWEFIPADLLLVQLLVCLALTQTGIVPM
ncbi:hypothetical protein ACFVS9_31660 [Streptomyces sp. NPDC058008]|uniref:hypothetical protein n=1 Tax=Streptomyces sp. NPDC058008 TaxID=3346303 RepID=UPI0036E3D2E4